VLLQPLPFKDPDRLMMLYESNLKEDNYNIVSGGMFAEWRNQNRSFSNLALVEDTQFALSASGGQMPEKLTGALVSWNLFTTLGVRPALGRDFSAADDTPSANFTAILSWSLWKRRFGADPAILNQTVYIDAKPYTVIGVMPDWFAFPQPATQVWASVYRDKPPGLMAMLNERARRAPRHAFRQCGSQGPPFA